MENFAAWSEIGGEGPGDLVLAVDFTASGRPEARFADLFRLTDTGQPAWETESRSLPTEIGPSGQEYVERWLAPVRESGRTVSAVLGFCIGGVYAAELADRIEEFQGARPQLLLFDPEKATPQTLYWQFHKVVDLFTPLLGADRTGAVHQAGRDAITTTTDLASLGRELVKLFREVSEDAFEQLGFTADRRAEFTEAFTSFVAYVVGAGDLDATAAWTGAVAFTSATPVSGLNPLRTQDPAGADGVVGRELFFEAQHVDLLRDERAARTLADLLARD